MQVLSATDALSPAIARTRDLLFRPFRWGTFLKLSAVAVFTEGFSGNANFGGSHHGGNASEMTPGAGPFAQMPLHFTPAMIAGLIMLGLGLLVLGIVLFYVSVRLRFALFDCLIHQTTRIAPGWTRYRYQALRFFLLAIAVGLVFFLIVAAIALPFAFGFIHVFQENQATGQFPIAPFLALFLPLIPIILVMIVAAVAVDIVLRDFMLPHIALENASAGQAWAAVRARISAQKGSFLLYAVLRVFVPFAAMIAIALVLAIPCLIVFGGLIGLLVALHAATSAAATGPMVLGSLFEVLIGLAIAVLAILLIVSVGGPLSIAVRNYAIVFYGGRYPVLGDILWPPPPPAPALAPSPGIA